MARSIFREAEASAYFGQWKQIVRRWFETIKFSGRFKVRQTPSRLVIADAEIGGEGLLKADGVRKLLTDRFE